MSVTLSPAATPKVPFWDKNFRQRLQSAVWLLLILGGLVYYPHPYLVAAVVGTVVWALVVEWTHLTYYPAPERRWASRWLMHPLGMMYVALAWQGLHILLYQKKMPHVFMNILGALCINDTFAFLIGRRWGVRKMIPIVSPGKTWMGFLGGIGASTLFCSLLSWVAPQWGLYPLWSLCAAAGAVIGVMGVVGDLMVSAVKRVYKVKDSGVLIAGHGGLWDLLDGLLYVLAIVYLLRVWAPPVWQASMWPQPYVLGASGPVMPVPRAVSVSVVPPLPPRGI